MRRDKDREFMNKPMITAHSGCEGTEIDSMESIDLALEYGAEAVEVDVRVDQAGELRISHNEVSLEEFQTKLTLREVMEKLDGTDMILNCDIKEQTALYETLRKAELLHFPRERLVLSGCTGLEQLARDPRLTKRARFFLNIEEVLKFVYLHREMELSMERIMLLMRDPWVILKDSQIRDILIKDTVLCYQMLGAEAANLPKRLLGTPLVMALRMAGIPLSVWTVNEVEIARACLQTNVFNITTRQVRDVMQVRDKWLAAAHKAGPFKPGGLIRK